MRFPWSKVKPKQFAEDYTTLVNQLLYASASGGSVEASSTATARACSLLWARTLAAAEVTPTGLITPSWLHQLGQDLIVSGEHLSVIEVDDRVRLRRASTWTVTAKTGEWRYHADLPRPTTPQRVNRPPAGVVWIPWAASPTQPWKGVGPLSAVTATALARLERSISEESDTTTGYPLPAPLDGGSAAFKKLAVTAGKMKGNLMLVESFANAYGEGKGAAPLKDWVAERFGPRFAADEVTMRGELVQSVANACGVPPELLRSGDGTAARASYVRFILEVATPLLRIIEEELREKLNRPVSLTLAHLVAHDIDLAKARARKTNAEAARLEAGGELPPNAGMADESQ